MAKKTAVQKAPKEHWKVEPDEHDYPAASSYLGMLMPADSADRLVGELRSAGLIHQKAKDILRASRLDLLPVDNVHVAKDLARVRAGQKLSPVLLVRGNLTADVALTVADGYHRVCASYHLDEDADIPCRLVDLVVASSSPPARPAGKSRTSGI